MPLVGQTRADWFNKIIIGDCLKVLPTLSACSADSVVTDPPYGLEFMGKEWDRLGGGRTSKPGIGDRKTEWVNSQGWNRFRCAKCGHLPHGGSPCQCATPDIRISDDRWQRMQEWYFQWATTTLRVLKPGGYMLAFGGTRTYHRLACAVEDAGFEIRDCIMWLYGSGFPKGKSCLKPAWEPILLARKPGPRVQPLGIDDCRIPLNGESSSTAARRKYGFTPNTEKAAESEAKGRLRDRTDPAKRAAPHPSDDAGRYPANVVHDGSEEVLEAFAAFGDRPGATNKAPLIAEDDGNRIAGGKGYRPMERDVAYRDNGSAARFFYCAKASRAERGAGNNHPTVKPLALIRWLVRLVTPSGGTVLDPFAGSGTTGLAAELEGRKSILIEKEPQYAGVAQQRAASAVKIALSSKVVGESLETRSAPQPRRVEL